MLLRGAQLGGAGAVCEARGREHAPAATTARGRGGDLHQGAGSTTRQATHDTVRGAEGSAAGGRDRSGTSYWLLGMPQGSTAASLNRLLVHFCGAEASSSRREKTRLIRRSALRWHARERYND